MDVTTLYVDLENATLALIGLARELTWNRIPDTCRFILTEIKNSEENFHLQRVLLQKENNKKIPVALQEVVPRLAAIYPDLYDIELYVYRAGKKVTIVEIRYFLKSALDEDYQPIVFNNPPMLHSKVCRPPWMGDEGRKFSINWEHQRVRNWIRMRMRR